MASQGVLNIGTRLIVKNGAALKQATDWIRLTVAEVKASNKYPLSLALRLNPGGLSQSKLSSICSLLRSGDERNTNYTPERGEVQRHGGSGLALGFSRKRIKSVR